MLSHQKVLALARQGEAEAIALLINQALSTRGIQVRAVCRSNCLHVLLEADPVPERLTYARIVYAAVLCLGAATIQTLQIYGGQQGAKQPRWVQAFRLLEPEVGVGEAEGRRQEEVGAEEAGEAGLKQLEHSGSKTQNSKPALYPRLSLPVALSICAASLGFGAGLSYLSYSETEEPIDPTATKITVPNSPDPESTQTPTAALTTTTLTATPTASPTATAPPIAPTSPQASAPADVAVTIKAVGDMVPGSNYPARVLPTEVGEPLAQEREMLFGNIKPFFGEADILFGNFESTLTDFPNAAKDTSQNMTFAFRTPPVYAQMLKELGFDMLSVANNHSMDFGEPGFADTITNIEQTGMKAVGKKGEIVYTTVNNVPVAFIGFSFLNYNNSMQDLATASALVKEAKKQAKIVVISVHAGAEGSDQTHVSNRDEYFFGENRGNSVNFARTLVDQGADLILGHGPHVPRAVELYQGKLIAYSLGNFLGYRAFSTVGTLGDSLILKVQMNAEGDFVGGRIIPVALDKNGIPKLDDYFKSVILIRNLTKQDFPQTPLTIDDMGYILRTDS